MRAWSVAVELSATMPGPPEVVWQLLTDWEHQDEWMLEATDFVVTTNARAGVGVEAEATIRLAGFTTRDRIRVTRWEPARRLRIEHLGWVQGSGDILLAPSVDRGTDLRWREALRCPALGPIGSLALLVLRPVMRRVFARDLRVLQALVRARSRGLEVAATGHARAMPDPDRRRSDDDSDRLSDAAKQRVEEDAAARNPDPTTRREALELELMDEDRSEVGEEIGDEID